VGEATRLERATHSIGGDRAELRLEAGVITIAKGATSQARPTEVTVPVDRVRSVEVRKPSRAASGWLHVAVVDGSPAPVTELAAMSDPYTIPLGGRQVAGARRLERMVADHVQRRGLPAESSGAKPRRPSSGVVLTDAPTTATRTSEARRRTATGDTAHARPVDARATDVEPTGTEPTGTEPASAEPTHVEPTGTEPASAEPTEVDPAGADLTAKLRELADLHRAGELTDDEFRRAKEAVLGA
jgi:hypothetical protein